MKRPLYIPKITTGYPSPTVVLLLFCTTILIFTVLVFLFQTSSILLNVFLTQAVALLLPCLLAVRTFGYKKELLFPLFRPRWLDVMLVISMTIAMGIVTDYLVLWTDILFKVPVPYREALKSLLRFDSGAELGMKVVLLAFVPALVEELYFRGFCQNGMASTYSKGKALFLASLFFAFAHINPWYLHIYLLLGIFIGTISMARGTLVLPIIAHLTNNLWTILTTIVGISLPSEKGYLPKDIAMCGVAAMFVIGLGIFFLLGTRTKPLSLSSGD